VLKRADCGVRRRRSSKKDISGDFVDKQHFVEKRRLLASSTKLEKKLWDKPLGIQPRSRPVAQKGWEGENGAYTVEKNGLNQGN